MPVPLPRRRVRFGGMTSADERASPQHPPDVAAAGAAASTEHLPTGWVALVRNHWLTEFTVSGFWLAMGVVIVGNSVNVVLSESSIGVKVAVWVGVMVGGVVAIVLWYRFKPVTRVNFDTGELRVGRRTIAMNDVRWARLVVVETKKSRSITLQFGPGVVHTATAPGSPRRPSYVVRTARGHTPPAENGRWVAEVLRRSSIALPQTPDDPSGRFTWFNFPGYITREQAIEIVLNPPAEGDPLPIPPSHTFDVARRGRRRAAERDASANGSAKGTER
jgi:hypothetical protein